jgi:hypothetical protein
VTDYAKDRRKEHVKNVKNLGKAHGFDRKTIKKATKLAKDRYPKNKG